MKAAGERLRERLASVALHAPAIEVYAYGGRRHGTPGEIVDNVVAQLSGPVRWSDVIRDMVARGATRIVECGPGRVLTGLNRRIERNKDIAMLAIEDPASLATALA
jgi:[acyl-carrier-protein] S-malonyltransferase